MRHGYTSTLLDGERILVYTLKKGIKDTIIYNEKAFERFGFRSKNYYLTTSDFYGDPSDNIIGIKGIGDKTGYTFDSKNLEQ